MRHQEFEPPAELRDIIKCFWYHCIDFGTESSNFEIIPDGYAEIIFHFGSECSVAQNGDWQPLPSPFLMGLLNQPAVIRSENQLSIIGIRCFPWAVFELLGLAPTQEKVHFFEHPILGLQSSLKSLIQAGRKEEAVFEVGHFLVNEVLTDRVHELVVDAGTAMLKANGTLAVSEVAAAAHATVRTLERKFKCSSGHTVKDVSGLMRFEQVRNRLWLQPSSSLTGLAAEFGYTDQAHLSRDFKRYSGTTPAAFARQARAR